MNDQERGQSQDGLDFQRRYLQTLAFGRCFDELNDHDLKDLRRKHAVYILRCSNLSFVLMTYVACDLGLEVFQRTDGNWDAPASTRSAATAKKTYDELVTPCSSKAFFSAFGDPQQVRPNCLEDMVAMIKENNCIGQISKIRPIWWHSLLVVVLVYCFVLSDHVHSLVYIAILSRRRYASGCYRAATARSYIHMIPCFADHPILLSRVLSSHLIVRAARRPCGGFESAAEENRCRKEGQKI